MDWLALFNAWQQYCYTSDLTYLSLCSAIITSILGRLFSVLFCFLCLSNNVSCIVLYIYIYMFYFVMIWNKTQNLKFEYELYNTASCEESKSYFICFITVASYFYFCFCFCINFIFFIIVLSFVFEANLKKKWDV